MIGNLSINTIEKEGRGLKFSLKSQKSFNTNFEVLFERILSFFGNKKGDYRKKTKLGAFTKEVFDNLAGQEAINKFINNILNDYIKHKKLPITKTTDFEALKQDFNIFFKNKIPPTNETDFEMYINSLDRLPSIYSGVKYQGSKISKKYLIEAKKALDALKTNGF
jgi:hypothetical protein